MHTIVHRARVILVLYGRPMIMIVIVDVLSSSAIRSSEVIDGALQIDSKHQ